VKNGSLLFLFCTSLACCLRSATGKVRPGDQEQCFQTKRLKSSKRCKKSGFVNQQIMADGRWSMGGHQGVVFMKSMLEKG
jgi:hypothetical protein